MKTVHNYLAKLGYKLSVAANGLNKEWGADQVEEEVLNHFHQILVDSIDSHLDLELSEDRSFDPWRFPQREYKHKQAKFVQKLLEETLEEVVVDSLRKQNTFSNYPNEDHIERYGTIQLKELFPDML